MTPSNPPDEPEPDVPTTFGERDKYGCSPNQRTGVSSRPLPHLSQPLYEDIAALVNEPLRTLNLGEDQSSEGISLCACGAAVRGTRPLLDYTSTEDDTLTLQRAQAVLVRLVGFYRHSTSPALCNEIVVPALIAHRLVRVPQWLGTASVPPYVHALTWNFEFKDGKIVAVSTVSSELAREMPDPPRQRPSTQPCSPIPVPRIPAAGASYESYFIPANPSLLGCIEEPEGRPICTGGYSDVWRCNVRFSAPSELLPVEVAVKVLRSVWLSNRDESDANERKLRRFMQEVITWLGLPKHPNIVPLIGWTLTPNLSFISPWYKQGNLYRHLKHLSDAQRIQILLGIAKGLECLHSRSPPIVHGDLKPENILMSDLGEPLLADFGLSTILGEERMYTSSHRVGGSVPWMSPEQMIEGSRSCQSDVYSFGSLALTVMTGDLPHAGLTDGQITLKVCSSNDPKDPVEDWSKYSRLQEPIKDILRDCWLRSPDARPSMSVIVRRLQTVLKSRELQ